MSDKTPSPTINPKKFQEDVAINPSDLDSGMLSQASMFAYYAVAYAEAQRREGKLRMNRDIVKAKVDKKVRDEFAAEGRKFTEAVVSSAVSTDNAFVAAQLALNDAKANTALGHAALEAFKHRRDMIIQLCVANREELKGQARVRSAVAGKPDMEPDMSRAETPVEMAMRKVRRSRENDEGSATKATGS